MNSLDPWRVILTSPSGYVILPAASYGHPLYRAVPSWIHYGSGSSTQRLLFDGAFIGADPAAPVPPRGGLTAEVAPVLAPATGGITVRNSLDAKQVLHVEICVDGKCYSTSMDLAPAISLVMAKLAQWHKDQHALEVAPTVVDTVDAAVGEAVSSIAGELVGRHVDSVCGSWLSDLGNVVKKVALGPLAPIAELGPVAAVLRKFKGPIGAAAGVAAAAGATMIPGVGPIAAPLAGKLANDLVNSTLGEQGAKKRVEQATRRAADDPTTAAALVAAQKAVAQSTAAHYVQDTAKRAAAGDSTAQQKIVDVAQGVEKGDPAAKAVADLIANAMQSEWGAKLWEKVTGRGPAVSGWYDLVGGASPVVVGAFWDKVKNAVLTVTLTKQTNQFIKDNKLEPYVKLASQAVATYYGGPAAGAAAGAISPMVMNLGVEDKKKAAAAQQDVQGVKATVRRRSPQLTQAANVAQQAIEHTATAYQVAQMAKDAKAGVPEAQQSLANLQAAAAAGDQDAALALQAVATFDREQRKSTGAASVGAWHVIAGAVIGMGAVEAYPAGYGEVAAVPLDATVGAVYETTVGAKLVDVRRRAAELASKKAGTAVGVIHAKKENVWYIYAFKSLDDAIDWLQGATQDRARFTYAAIFEKDANGMAFIQDEEIGGSRRPAAPPGEQIRREIAMVG